MVPEVEDDQLTFLMGNIRNIIPKSDRNKVRLIEDMASQDKVNIICLSETHLKDEIFDAEVSMNDFNIHRVE